MTTSFRRGHDFGGLNFTIIPKDGVVFESAQEENIWYNKKMECKNCGKETEQIKAGKTRAGSQKYKCKHCGKVYTPKPKERTYSEEIKKQAIKLYM